MHTTPGPGYITIAAVDRARLGLEQLAAAARAHIHEHATTDIVEARELAAIAARVADIADVLDRAQPDDEQRAVTPATSNPQPLKPVPATIRLHNDDRRTVALYEGTVTRHGLETPELPYANLYIELDGHDIGSLWPHQDEETGRVVVTLGGWDTEGDWTPTTTVHAPTHPNGPTTT